MDSTETPAGTDPATPECLPCDPENDSDAGIAEQGPPPAQGPSGPNGPTVAEIGAHFAAEIAENAAKALCAAAWLGPKRVLALLA